MFVDFKIDANLWYLDYMKTFLGGSIAKAEL